VNIAGSYMMLEKYDKAQDWLEKGYELHDPLKIPFKLNTVFRANCTPSRYSINKYN
jgi:hypothetical protein